MICNLLFYEEKEIKKAKIFFKSINMDFIKVEDFEAKITIDFIHTPEVLKIFSIEAEPMICGISALGISFYLPIMPREFVKTSLIAENENIAGGVVFCPMSNIMCINTLGGLRYELYDKPTDLVKNKSPQTLKLVK